MLEAAEAESEMTASSLASKALPQNLNHKFGEADTCGKRLFRTGREIAVVVTGSVAKSVTFFV